MKFKVGDKVKIIKIWEEILVDSQDCFIGKTGTIASMSKIYYDNYPYKVIFDDKTIQALEVEFWRDEELELVANTTKTTIITKETLFEDFIKYVKKEYGLDVSCGEELTYEDLLMNSNCRGCNMYIKGTICNCEKSSHT